MKKILYLSLVASSIFSMQLDLIKRDTLQEKSSEYSYLNMDDVKKVRIQPSSVFVPDKLGSVELYHGKKGFSVRQDDKKYQIKKYFTDPMLRDITKQQLHAFLQAGYLSINRMNDGEFSLKAKGRINGGGPYFGGFMYWLTKSVCYGGLAAAAGTTVVATGGAIVATAAGGAVAGGAGTVTALAVAGNTVSGTIITTAGATTIGATIATTAGVGVGVASTAGAVATGAGIVATAATATAAGAVVTEAAVLTTGAAVATGATAGGIVVGIEALSVAVGTFFGMLPTP